MEKSMVVLQDKELRAGTLIMSQGFQIEHRALRKLVIKYKAEFEELGIIASPMQKSDSKKAGRPVEEFMLNEDQAMYLGTLLTNNVTVRRFKLKMVKEFSRMKKRIASDFIKVQNAEWIEKRNSGKLIRHEETDTIKGFVDYAVAQGSQSAKMYYVNISKMKNQSLFLLDQKYPNLRNMLNLHQLSTIETADKIVSNAIAFGMESKLPYKAIYQLAKERVELFASMVGKSIVAALELKQLNIE